MTQTPQQKLTMEIRLRMGRNNESVSDRKVSKATGGAFSPKTVGRVRDGGDVKVSDLVAAAKAAGFEVVVREVVK